MPIDHLMKVKTSSGYDILYPITKPENVKTVEQFEVMLPTNTKVGSYVNGDVITADTPVSVILKKMLQVQVPPTYKAPSISLTATGNTAGKYEVGTSVSPAFSSKFTKNDAGEIITHQITKNGTQVATSTTTPLSHSETFTLTDDEVVFVSACSYNAGTVKDDNFGEPYPTGSIASGSISSSTLKFTPYRAYFYGVDNESVAPATSDDVRALTNTSTTGAGAGTTFEVKIAAGQKRGVIAYPATIRDISKVLYVEAGNDDYTFKFKNPETIAVEGKNGASAINYKVYTWISAQPFAAAMTLKVTI